MPEEEQPWFIMIGQERQGPMSENDVKYLLGRKRIDGGTLIWREGMETWARLREVDTFQPKSRPEPEEEPEAEASPAPQPPSERAPEPAEESGTSRFSGYFVQRIVTILALLGLLGGGLYILFGDPPTSRRKDTAKERARARSDRLAKIRSGEPATQRALLKEGARAVPGLIQALSAKGTGIGDGLPPEKVKGLLIEIGPSAASAIGEALEGLEDLDLTGATKILLVEVLGEFGGPQSIPSLIIALGDSDPAVQEEAKDAIARIDPALGPTLARYLTKPARPLSKQQRKNLADALGKQHSQATLPELQKTLRTELNPEVKQALTKAVENINAWANVPPPPKRSTPPATEQNQPAQATVPSNTPSDADTQRPPNINISVSATATATATAQSEEEKAEQLAREAAQHLENGDRDKAIEAYKQAHAIVARRAWLLIIFDLKGIDPDSAEADTATRDLATDAPEELEPLEEPDPPIALSEIHQALTEPDPTLEKFSGGSGTWEGNLDSIEPIAHDGIRELYIARGSPKGQDFIVSLAPRQRSIRNIETGETRRWGGVLRGFRIVDDNGQSRMLPVLAVELIE
ncbi:MAG: hypothetical protein CME26_02325 [Gemmatimonadetes bacterium]|nr:hypothetical protein [Gemmatimonadota bacterium]